MARSSIDSLFGIGASCGVSIEVDERIPPSSLIEVMVKSSPERESEANFSLIGATGRWAITGVC